MKPTTLRRTVDVLILVVIVLGALYYLPKLAAFAERVRETGPDDPGWDARYPRALYYTGLVPFVGSMVMLLPCLSFFAAPLGGLRRAMLAVLCLVPMAVAGYGVGIAPPALSKVILGLGGLFSLGVWLFALPPVLVNITFIDLATRWAGRKRPDS